MKYNKLSEEISRCSGVGCPLKNECDRYTTQFVDDDNELLWYIEPKYENNKCDFIITSK